MTETPIRVTHVAKTTGHGGVAVAVSDWCKAMAEYGVESRVVYVAEREHVVIAREFERNDIACRVTSGAVAALREVTGMGIANLVGIGPRRVLHVHTGLPMIRPLADFLRRLAGPRAPSVITLHGASAMARDDRMAPIWARHRVLASRWSVLTTPSDAEAAVQRSVCDDSTVVRAVCCCRRRETANLTIDTHPTDAIALARLLEVTRPQRILVTVGRLHPQKDHATLIRAFAIVAREVPDVLLAIIGEGEERPQLGALLQDLAPDVAARVRLLGHIVDPSRLLAQATMFVSSSRAESFGLVAYEAALAGVPLVLSSIEPWRSAFREGEECLAFPPGDAPALASALRELLANPARAQAVAQRGRAAAMRDTDPVAIGRSWRAVYEEAMHRSG